MSGPTRDLPDSLIARLRTLFDERERAELILVAGQANLNNRAGNAAKQLLGDDS
jgi:alkylhydroperoxidase family enzyme